MGETTIVLPAAITVLALVAGLVQEVRHRRRLRRAASIRRVLGVDPASAG